MSDHPRIIRDTDSGAPSHAADVGGKAVGLFHLKGTGLEVPPFFAIPASEFRAALEAAGVRAEVDSLLDSVARGSRPSAAALRLQEIVLALQVPRDVTAACTGAFNAADRLAVRSSALGEDAAGASFAGIHDSRLYVAPADVVPAIRQVWASAFSERALTYRNQNRLPLAGIAVGVVVQRMIDARASGVAFSADPVTGDPDEIVVSAVFGCGEGLVSGGLDADVFRLRRGEPDIRSQITDKPEAVAFDPVGGGTHHIALSESLRGAPSLTEAQVREVVSALARIESVHQGIPQDVEFCFDHAGRLWLLQARPMTTAVAAGPSSGNRIVWDNSNIVESYSGVTSPMTFSFIRSAYAAVYESFAGVMGVRPAAVAAHRPVFHNMLGLIRGRVYYNLLNWYRLIRLFPGYSINRRFMESMMGVREPMELPAYETKSATGAKAALRRVFVDVPSLMFVVTRMLWNFARIRPLSTKFNAHFDRHFDEWAKLDLDTLKPQELMQLYRKMEQTLLWNWRAPIINDFYTMVYHGTLRKLCAKWCGDAGEALSNDLFRGIGAVESAKPADDLVRLAAIARGTTGLRDLLLSLAPAELAADVGRFAAFPAFYAAYQRYLSEWGYRCTGELKLEERSLRDDPSFIFQVLRNYLQDNAAPPASPDQREQQELLLRREAEKRARTSIRGLFAWPKRLLFMRVLRNARNGVRQREVMRYKRTKIFGLVRDLLNAMGRRLAEARALDDPRDIYCLRIEEVWDAIRGTAESTDLKSLVRARKAEYDGYRAEPDPPPRIVTYGFVGHQNTFRFRPAAASTATGTLQGTPCSPGRVTGVVKVLLDPRDGADLRGEILVARRTDPGWVSLYPSISGLLVERGSVLSHSAIVAREMGIPAIVGMPGLTDRLRDGMVVTVDGTAGTVEIIEPAQTPPTGSTQASQPK